MGQYYHPQIITNGLVTLIDPANQRSYPRSGTTAFSLTGNHNATLTGGVGFGTSNMGVFNFDGVNDYLDLGNSAGGSGVAISTGTINVWAKTSSPGSSYRGIVAKQFAYGLFYKDSILIAYDWANIGGGDRTTNINLADNQWKNISYSFQTGVSNGSIIYIGGTSVNTGNLTINNQEQSLAVGAEPVAGSQFSNCTIGHFALYNRVLTADEIRKNFNALRNRYGV